MANLIDSKQNSDNALDPMRNSVRFPLHLFARVDTVRGTVDAVTEDISSTGVLFTMPFAPEVNTRLTWTLQFPAEAIGSPFDVTVTCVGRVVWHGPSATGRQVGAVIDDYRMGDSVHV
ncbi:MAG: PilZ domain-containing protein [Janthinobacterium lividum]